MSLYELVCSINLQGDIRLSMWENDTEKVLATWEECDHLWTGDIEEWEDLIVDYIFCPGDGWMHIEVKEEV